MNGRDQSETVSVPATSQATVAEPRPLTERLVERVADATDRDPTALPPLFEAVDPEALDRLVTSGSASLRAEFEYADCSVAVFGDEHVRVRTADE